MSEIVKIIKDARKDGLSDQDVLLKIEKIIPEKKKAFEEVKKRGASSTQILDKIIEDNVVAEKNIKKEKEILQTINEGRKDFLKDEEVLEKIIAMLPEKKKAFEEVKKRGASSTQILDKIILDNKKEGVVVREEKKMDVELEKKDVVQREEKTKEILAKTGENKISHKKSAKKTIAKIKGTRLFSEFFSITRYLLIGIDISDHSIEMILLNKDRTITSYGRDVLKEGIVYNGEILNQKELSDSLKRALRNTKPTPLDITEHTMKKKVTLRKKNHKAIISLPESKTYVHLFEFADSGKLYAKIEEKIKSTIPFDYEDLYWDFMEIPSKDDGVKVLCVAAQRDIVDSYIYFFKSANIDPVVFDIQGASIGRALLSTKKIRQEKRRKEYREVMVDGKSKMIVDFGSKTTTLNIFNEDAILVISVPLPYAGNYFTKKISEELDIDINKANEIKKGDGFLTDGRAYKIMEKCGKKIIEEIEAAMLYYKRQFKSEIKEIIITGGTSLLPEFAEFLQKQVPEISIKMGDPSAKINNLDLIEKRDMSFYSNVIGLGLRSLSKDPIKEGINLLPEEIKNQERRSQVEKHRSVLLVALFIAIAGIMFLGLSAYYLIYLPVPAPIQPLKQRVLLQIEDRSGGIVEMAVIKKEPEEEPLVRRGPGREQEVIGEATPGQSYEATAQLAGWVRIKFGEEEGWIYGDVIERIDTIGISSENIEEEIIDIINEETEQDPSIDLTE